MVTSEFGARAGTSIATLYGCAGARQPRRVHLNDGTTGVATN